MKKAAKIVLLFVLAIMLVNLIARKSDTKEKVEAVHEEIKERRVYIGAWVSGSWDNNSKTLETSVIKDFENLIDKKLAIVNIYADWTYLPNPSLLSDLDQIAMAGWTPMISSNPLFFDGCPKNGRSLYETIANGDCDPFLKSIAINLSKFQKPVMLRFAWEMNLPNMYWSVTKLGSKPTDFIKAWRRFNNISKEYAKNIIWVLSFNTTNSATIPYKDLYPGDEYVDWVAIDGYNWGNSHEWSGWASFDGTFRNSYKELTEITSKPVMLSEVNSAPTGGDKATWLKDMLESQIPNNYPLVNAFVFFNENKSSGESVDWRLEKSNDYVTAVKEGLRNKLYVSSFP